MLLEVIATSTRDALAAERGGADRVEVCVAIERDGLTPPSRLVAEIRAAVEIPVRAMLRPGDGFALGVGERERPAEEAAELVEAGADGFVLGFLDEEGEIDLPTMEALVPALGGRRWTFHRAIDHSRDPIATYRALASLRESGCDTVLTAGSPQTIEDGLPSLYALAAESAADPAGPDLMAGGGLRPERVPDLAARGITAFHVGAGARESWSTPVDPTRVAAWRTLIDAQSDRR
ncbi:MAG: copper homeostasis protein CutC [Solirubrobacterales bacterium]